MRIAGLDHLSDLSQTSDTGFYVFVQLEAFLTQRVTEMGEEGDVVAMSQFQLAPSIIQGQSREYIREMLSEVQDLQGRLTSLRMQHLFMIQASPRYAAISDSHSVNFCQHKSIYCELKQESINLTWTSGEKGQAVTFKPFAFLQKVFLIYKMCCLGMLNVCQRC